MSFQVKGVSWMKSGKRTKRWYANITIKGKQKSLGYYHSAEEAARAYDKAAKEYFGEFANLNFPEENQ